MSTVYYFPVVLEKEKGGIAVHVIGLEGIFTTGETEEIARKNATEAINLHLSTLAKDKLDELEPYTKPPEEVKVEVMTVTHPPLPIQ